MSLGCPKNVVDGMHASETGEIEGMSLCEGVSHAGEVLLGDLHRSGFMVVSEHEEADAIIVNTCGFVEDAKNESLEVSVLEGGGSTSFSSKPLIAIRPHMPNPKQAYKHWHMSVCILKQHWMHSSIG